MINSKLTDRKNINAKLEKLTRSNSAKNKAALRSEISNMEAQFHTAHGYRISYNWEK